MNGELPTSNFQRPTSNVQRPTSNEAAVTTDHRVLDFLRESGVTVVVDEALLRRIHDAMEATVRAGEEVVALIREAAGTHPGPIPANLITTMQLGTGFHRSGRDTLRALFTARNSARRERRKTEAK